MGKRNNQLHHYDGERWFPHKSKCTAYLSSILGSLSLFYQTEWNSSINPKFFGVAAPSGPLSVLADVEEWIGDGVSDVSEQWGRKN